MKATDGRLVLRRAYPRKHPLRPKVEEYIRESEHQDGPGYWRNFNTPEEILKDFKLYLDFSDADSEK